MKRFDPAVEALFADLRASVPAHITTATFDPGLREAFGPAGPRRRRVAETRSSERSSTT